jgi:hypothetical protein
MILRPGFPSHPMSSDGGAAPAQNGHEGVIKLTSALVPNPLSIRPFTWSLA